MAPLSIAAERTLPLACTRIPKTLSPTIPANSLKIVTWNAGGLHSSRYVELMSWLETHDSGPIHVCCVQESHWPSSSEYSNHRWVFVHTGSSSSTGGVLMIINRSVACPAQLQHAELHAGRLLHVRVQSEPAVDLLGTYQHAGIPTASSVCQPLRMAFSSCFVRDKKFGIRSNHGRLRSPNATA